MSIQDELRELDGKIRGSDDPQELARMVSQCETLIANLNTAAAAETDASVKQYLEQTKRMADETAHRAREKLAEVKVARMDPLYEQRKAEKAAGEERKKMEDLQKAQQFLAGGGLGNLLGGLFGAAKGAAPAGVPAVCPKCAVPVGAAKFCPECGTPIPQERKCAECGAKLAPSVKFCPECGKKA